MKARALAAAPARATAVANAKTSRPSPATGAPASSLARFQTAFVQALGGDASDAALGREARSLLDQPAFAVYRNTVARACIDALAANYPAVRRLVGDEWFRAAAAVFVRERPPADPRLVLYGDGYADFLAAFEPAAELPYLADVARLDRFWIEAHTAPNAVPADAGLLQRLDPAALAATTLAPLPSARWAWFELGPIFDIWSRNRCDDDGGGELTWQPQGALVLRPHDTVRWIPLAAGACAFLDACAAGEPLAVAAQAASEREPGCALASIISDLLAAGAFAAIAATKEEPR